VGSQSLSKLEMEARREIGVIFRDKKVVKQMEAVFEKDWKQSEPVIAADAGMAAFNVPAKKVAKEVAKQISIKPMVEQMLDKVMDTKDGVPFETAEVTQSVRDAFREEVHGAVASALHELVTETAQEDKKESAARAKD
jgi:cardiolipin synthase A/B